MKQILTIIFLIKSIFVFSQIPGATRGPGNNANMNMGHYYGKVVDISGKGIEFVSVQLIQNKLDTVTKQRKDFVVAGMLTTKKGEFSLENLNIMAQYKLKITASGYKTYEAQKLGFDMSSMRGGGGGRPSGGEIPTNILNAIDKDLGNIKLEIDATVLNTVTVTASKPLLQMNIDRKVFNVEKNLTSVGGTAIDVMKNVPTVNVDIDGNVQMRNASPQIFVDGRPTTLTLDQIPADAISTVELITNPSAKFDASGGGAGIINIVLKKNKKTGYNGNIRLSVDSRPRPGSGFDINVRQSKINFSASINANTRKSITTSETERIDFLRNNNSVLINQNNGPIGNGMFLFGRTGVDYFVDNRNTFSLTFNAVKGQFKNKDLINIDRDTVFGLGNTNGEIGKRNSDFVNNVRNIGGTFGFKHNFTNPGKELTFDFTYNNGKNNNTNAFNTQYFSNNLTPKTPLTKEKSVGGGDNRNYVFQLDFANPFRKDKKIETGLRMQIRDVYTFNNNFIVLSNGNELPILNLNNTYKFNDFVYAGYVTYSEKIKKISYNIGLRLETSKYDGNLITTNQKFSNKFPLSLFPSAFLTYKINETSDVQMNFSRKINRPNFFNILPFIDYTDSLNLSIGNPNLLPEFTTLLEFSFQKQLPKSNSLLFTVYAKNTEGLIARYQYRDKNPDPSKIDSVIFNTYKNANRAYNIGLEINSRNKIAKWWDMNTSINLFNSTLEVDNTLVGANTNNQFSWFVKWNNNLKLPKNYSMQISGDYQAKSLIPQGGGGGGRGPFGGGGMFLGGGNQANVNGYIKSNYGVDASVKKDFMKNNAASLTLSISDIFRSKINGSVSSNEFFSQETYRLRDPQLIRLTFNYKFGKIDATLFKRKNLKGEGEGAQGAMSGVGG